MVVATKMENPEEKGKFSVNGHTAIDNRLGDG
jgi:hypothetical protein